MTRARDLADSADKDIAGTLTLDAVNASGVITGLTVEATGDTAAGDNAAMGYTAAEGLILTGQGSTSDITLKNDADAVVFTVPTGTDDILFPDNAKAMFGAGSDLQIYHNGSHSYISDQGTGNLHLLTNHLSINNAADDEAILHATQDGAVTLFYNGVSKLATTATGVDVTGTLTIPSQLIHAGDTDTYLTFATNAFGIIAGNKTRISSGDTETVINEDHIDLDFRVESNDNANMLFVDASANTIGIGTTEMNVVGNNTSGINFLSDGMVGITRLGVPLKVNRRADGDIVEFYSAAGLEGTISISGSTTSYNGFSGLHESSGILTNIPVGTVVSTIDELDVYAAMQGSGTEQTPSPKAGQTRADHAKVKVSDTAGDACVYGVVGSFNAQDKVNVVSVGIGSVRVTGACAKGDLLESNGDGTAKVQSDDIVRSKTIGKVTISNSNTGVKLVSCVMYCG